MSIGAKMAGGNPDPERGRDPDEYYPTPDDVTDALLRRWGTRLALAGVAWEPCAGDGRMAKRINEYLGIPVLCSDIKPRDDMVVPVYQRSLFDFGQLNPRIGAVITNPPFNIAAKILWHLRDMQGGPPPFLALVLKSTFWHAAKRYDLFKSFQPAAVHPLLWRPDFKNLGAPTMEICWTVWMRDHVGPTLYEPFARL